MATSKSLHKVQKQISKKRGGKSNSLHENSRDSQRLRRAGAREDKIARIVAAASRANQTYGEDVYEPIASLNTDPSQTKWTESHSSNPPSKTQQHQ